MWLHWPQTKRRMNQIHGAAVQAQGVQARRGPLRDALTLLDEKCCFARRPGRLAARAADAAVAAGRL